METRSCILCDDKFQTDLLSNQWRCSRCLFIDAQFPGLITLITKMIELKVNEEIRLHESYEHDKTYGPF